MIPFRRKPKEIQPAEDPALQYARRINELKTDESREKEKSEKILCGPGIGHDREFIFYDD